MGPSQPEPGTHTLLGLLDCPSVSSAFLSTDLIAVRKDMGPVTTPEPFGPEAFSQL